MQKNHTSKYPKKVPELKITFAFDISTITAGYAFFINGEPFDIGKEYKNARYTMGQVPLQKTEEYTGRDGISIKLRNVKYKAYGDQVYNSFPAISSISNWAYCALKQVHTFLEHHKKEFNVTPKITFYNVYEVSEIPTTGKYAPTSTVKKLALYVGMVLQAITGIINLSVPRIAHQVQTKLITPKEWQLRVLGKCKKGETKKMSVKKANEYLKKIGFAPLTEKYHDAADAINIATVAHLVKDDSWVKAAASEKKKKKRGV